MWISARMQYSWILCVYSWWYLFLILSIPCLNCMDNSSGIFTYCLCSSSAYFLLFSVNRSIKFQAWASNYCCHRKHKLVICMYDMVMCVRMVGVWCSNNLKRRAVFILSKMKSPTEFPVCHGQNPHISANMSTIKRFKQNWRPLWQDCITFPFPSHVSPYASWSRYHCFSSPINLLCT
jgi:hypothetical protein